MERSPGSWGQNTVTVTNQSADGESTSPTPSRSQSRPVTGSSCPCAKFVDVDTSRWYHEGLDYVVEYEIMNGITENRFAPNENITRGMVMTILYRMASSPEVTGGSPYTDVAENRYFSQAVAWAAESKGLQRAILMVPSAQISRSPGRS